MPELECPNCLELVEEDKAKEMGWVYAKVGRFRVAVCSKECKEAMESRLPRDHRPGSLLESS